MRLLGSSGASGADSTSLGTEVALLSAVVVAFALPLMIAAIGCHADESAAAARIGAVMPNESPTQQQRWDAWVGRWVRARGPSGVPRIAFVLAFQVCFTAATQVPLWLAMPWQRNSWEELPFAPERVQWLVLATAFLHGWLVLTSSADSSSVVSGACGAPSQRLSSRQRSDRISMYVLFLVCSTSAQPCLYSHLRSKIE